MSTSKRPGATFGRRRTAAHGAPAIAAWLTGAWLTWLAGAWMPVWAADLKSTVSAQGGAVLLLSGEVTTGDAARLKNLLTASLASGKAASAIRLDSPGGNLVEAVKLAAVVHRARIATVVVAGATCAGACFVALIAGTQKFISATATIGAPGAAARKEPSGRTPVVVRDEMPAIVRAVKDLGLLDAIVTKMLATPEEEILWLSADDLGAMGATMTGKPARPR